MRSALVKVDICYLVSHGFASRMLLQTNLLAKIAESGLSVAVITPDDKDANLLELKSHYANIFIEEWHEKITLWDDDYLHRRMYFLEDIDGNPALKEKIVNGLFFSDSWHPWKRIRPIFYYMIYQLTKLFPSIRKNFLKKEGTFLNSVAADRLIEKISPTLVISTYPVSVLDAKLLYAAKKQNISTVIHLLSWDNISCKGRFPVVAERFIVWGDVMAEELKEYYEFSDDLIYKCGVPHFDDHLQSSEDSYIKNGNEISRRVKQPYLFFAMSSPRFAPREIDIVEWLADAVNKDTFGINMNLVVRPHPQNVQTFMADKSWLTRLHTLEGKRVSVDYPQLNDGKLRWSMKNSDMRNLSQRLANCAVCLNSGSTVSIDALIHRKPVILTSFDGHAKLPYWKSARRLIDYPHLHKFVREGGAIATFNFDELYQTINEYLSDPQLNRENREFALKRQIFRMDGKATDRVVETIGIIRKEVSKLVFEKKSKHEIK